MQRNFKAGQHCRVITAYKTAYPDPLTLQAGEEVSVGQNDTQWPTYVWCTNQAGRGGWVPKSFIERTGERGVARRDYTARELSAAVGDELVIGEEAGGWLWCTNSQGQSGWIPAENVEVIADNVKRKTLGHSASLRSIALNNSAKPDSVCISGVSVFMSLSV